MVKYVKLFNEFKEFVRTTLDTISDEYERRLVGLILSHFDEVADCGTARASGRGC